MRTDSLINIILHFHSDSYSPTHTHVTEQVPGDLCEAGSALVVLYCLSSASKGCYYQSNGLTQGTKWLLSES